MHFLIPRSPDPLWIILTRLPTNWRVNIVVSICCDFSISFLSIGFPYCVPGKNVIWKWRKMFQFHLLPVCELTAEARDISKKGGKRHVHCPYDKCNGRATWHMTAWRHLQSETKQLWSCNGKWLVYWSHNNPSLVLWFLSDYHVIEWISQ